MSAKYHRDLCKIECVSFSTKIRQHILDPAAAASMVSKTYRSNFALHTSNTQGMCMHAKYDWNLCNNEDTKARTEILTHILDPLAAVASASNLSKTKTLVSHETGV